MSDAVGTREIDASAAESFDVGKNKINKCKRFLLLVLQQEQQAQINNVAVVTERRVYITIRFHQHRGPGSSTKERRRWGE